MSDTKSEAFRVFSNAKYLDNVVLSWIDRKVYFVSSYGDFEFNKFYYCVQQECANPEEFFNIRKRGTLLKLKTLSRDIERVQNLRFVYVEIIDVETGFNERTINAC